MASSVQNVMLAVNEKKTNSLELYGPLRDYLAERYSESVAVENEEDLEIVQQMRDDIQQASTETLELRRDLLQRYFRALCVMEPRFPVLTERDNDNSISFTWFDAFKGKKCTQQGVQFEKAAVTFNLGAVHSQLGVAADRFTTNGIKEACNYFQAAAGSFAFLRDMISMRASGNGGSSSVDVSGECASMLERLMLAQAQECFFEKVIMDEKAPALCGKIARQVWLYYEETHAALLLPPLNLHFDRGWVNHVQLKVAQFLAETCYRVGLDLHEKENIGEEIARLRVALDALTNAKKSTKGVAPALLDAIAKVETNINISLERAIKENDRVYLMRVPNAASLAPLPSASLVRSTDMTELLNASKEKIFTRLIPDTSAKALSQYTELVDNIVRMQVEKLQQETEITRVRLKELNLPESIHAVEGRNTLPENILRDVESIKLEGGTKGLDAGMQQLEDLRRVNQELIVQTMELVKKESEQDSKMRSQFGNRWRRPPSESINGDFLMKISKLEAKLKEAANVDAKLERSIKDNSVLIAILDVSPIESTLPVLSKLKVASSEDGDAIVADLKQSLTQLENLGMQRAQLEDAIKDIKQKDNIMPMLLSFSGSYEDLFDKELAKYDPLCIEVKRNVEVQENLLRHIMEQNSKFVSVYNLQEHQVACDRVVMQLSAAISKYHEIRNNIHNAGIKFYLSLQDAINNLKQQCSEYVMVREKETRNEIEILQRQLAGFSFNNNNKQSMHYPSMNNQRLVNYPASAPSEPFPATSSQGINNEVRSVSSSPYYNAPNVYPNSAAPMGPNSSNAPYSYPVPASSNPRPLQFHSPYQTPGSAPHYPPPPSY